jgi:hypothetical protein
MAPARLSLAVLMVLAASRASGGVLIEGTSGDRGAKGPERFLAEGQNVRVETKDGESALIFDGAGKRMIQVDEATRSYTVITQADMEKVRALMSQRGAAPSKKPFSRRYEKTARTDSALGKPCEVYRAVDAEGKSHDELCIAPFGSFGVERSDFEGFRGLGAFANAMAGHEGEQNWADLPGVPLVAWRTEGGARKETFRATKVEKRSIPATEFSVPAGWTRKPGPVEQLEQLELKMMQKGTR